MQNRYTLLFSLLALATTLSAQFNFNLYPTAICRGQINAAVGNDCRVNVTPAMIDEGSYTTFGTLSLSVLPRVLPLGTSEVTLVANNGFRTRTCRTSVLVEDKTAPNVACFSRVTLTLDDPTALPDALFADEVTVGISDNCGVAESFVTVGSLTYYGSTSYTVTVVDDSGNENSCWGIVDLQSPHYQGALCLASGDTGYEYIQSVRFNSSTSNRIYNSGDNGGQVFFTREYRLRGGDALTLTYAPGYVNGNYREYWRFYLDMNRDGDWTDAGEMIHQWNGSGGNSATVGLPTYFGRYGISRLRVVMSYGGYEGPCATGFYGEVEDYAVRLLPWWSSARKFLAQVAGKAGAGEPSDKLIVEVPQDRRVAPPARLAEQMEPVSEAAAVRVYPNPAVAGKMIRVDLEAGPQVQRLILRSVLGSVITEQTTAEGQPTQVFQLPENLQPGIYLLSGAGPDGRANWSRRVLVTN